MFSYTIEDELGNTDTAFVTINTTPCFVAGTLIRTPSGLRRVEDLRVGDRVVTRDNGAQVLRWVGTTRRVAGGPDAPIIFERNAIGDHGAVAFSPNHRVLVKSPHVAMLFEGDEMLVKAAHLVNEKTIRQQTGSGVVTYCHLLFDRHEIIFANGLESESYHPGAETLGSFDNSTKQELFDLFPELETGDYGPIARPCLRAHEGRLLSQVYALH